MLNNLTNFWNIITNKMIKKVPEANDLIPLGTRDSRYGGKYKPTGITVQDFIDSIPIPPLGVQSVTGLNTNNTNPLNPIVNIAVDGSTITGLGTPASPLIASQNLTSKYSNVVFVDVINGDDLTGLINRFDKPFATVGSALYAAAPMPAISTDNRALIYIRRGRYNNTIVNLTNYVDIYCESAVVFTGTTVIRDNGNAVNANIYGNLKIYDITSVTTCFSITGASVVTFEFDSIVCNAAAIGILPTVTGGKVIIKGNYIYSGANAQSFGVTIRGTANVVMNILYAIEAPQAVIRFRTFIGNATINCPNINLTAGGVFGGNAKMCLYMSDTSSTGTVTVNGNLNVIDTVNGGGIGAAITYWDGAPEYKLTVNGNINGNVIPAMNAPVGTGSVFQLLGNITSKINSMSLYGTGKFLFKNSVITTSDSAYTAPSVIIAGSAQCYFKDCYMFNAAIDQAIIRVDSLTSKLILDGCQGFASGVTAGTLSITTTVGGGLLYVNNSRFNKIKNASLTDIYSPSGLIIDANTQVPNIF
jgi:hypothetical protein